MLIVVAVQLRKSKEVTEYLKQNNTLYEHV